MTKIAQICSTIVSNKVFLHGITAIILFNGVIIGLETVDLLMLRFSDIFHSINVVVLWIFVAEAVIKIIAGYPKPQTYFQDGWNVFDFLVVVFCLIPDTGQLAMIARVLRVMRLLSVIPDLRVLVSVLLRSLPSMFNIVILTITIFYVYGILGHHMFHDVDPTHWRSLGISLLSLFRIITLEDWTDIMYAAMEAYWWAWIYFVSLILIGTFVVFNLIIAVVIQNHDIAVKEKFRQLTITPSQTELIEELRNVNESLTRLSERLDASQPQNAQS